jgi:pyruvate dehydrogenase E1 component beta subunit
MLLGVPGLKIVMPSTAADAKGLLTTAIEDDDPVLIFEHRWLMRRKGQVPDGEYRIPLGKGITRKTGKDLTVAGTSHAIVLAEEAAALLEKEGISVEVIDLRSVKPLDEELLIRSVERTGRFLAVDSAWQLGGFSAELCAVVSEKAFSRLKGPPRRLGLPDIPTPAGYTLEQAFYPDVDRIAAVMREMCR